MNTSLPLPLRNHLPAARHVPVQRRGHHEFREPEPDPDLLRRPHRRRRHAHPVPEGSHRRDGRAEQSGHAERSHGRLRPVQPGGHLADAGPHLHERRPPLLRGHPAGGLLLSLIHISEPTD